MAILGGCCLSLIYGQDNNWDLRNYHLYNPFALLEGRLLRDLFVTGMQTYFNPLIDVPYYILSVRLIPEWPRLVTFLSGVPFGLLILVVTRLATVVLPDSGRKCPAFIAAAIGLTGTATISEIGTTFGDMPIAIFVLSGLIPPLTLLRRTELNAARWFWSVMLAGLLCGTAAGLKPVGCIFAPGAALALALTAGGARRFIMTGFFFTVIWTVGFICAFGPWGMAVDRLFDSPIFPLMNHIFRSPWIPPIDVTDQRFLPRDIWQTLFWPIFWLRGHPFVVAEFGVRDPRFALAYVSLGVILCHAVRQRASNSLNRPAAALCIFFAVSFIAWEAVFSILRYALTIEVLTGILMTLALMILCGANLGDIRAERRLIILCGVILVAVFAASSRPGWGRSRGYGATVFDVQAPLVPDHSAVVFVAKPTAFIAPFLTGSDLIFVGIDEVPIPSRLGLEIKRRIQSRQSIMAVVPGWWDINDSFTSQFGFHILQRGCLPIVSANQRDLRMCPCEPIQQPG